MKLTKIKIQGKKQEKPSLVSTDSVIQLRESFVIEPATRGLDETHIIDLKDDDLIELTFEDNTVWFSSPFTLEEIFPENILQSRDLDDGFALPLFLSVDQKERGIVGNIFLKGLKIFTKKKIGAGIKLLAEELEKKILENRSGLYRLDEKFEFRDILASNPGSIHLLFLHGTASSTHGSFADLLGTEAWKHITQTYGSNVLAFQHESLSKSPLENLFDLVKQLPANATLDVISQSRGGLIGELLSRFCSNDENNCGFSSIEMERFEKLYPAAYYKTFVKQVDEINSQLQLKKITIRRFIRAACPAHGTTLASKRLDNLLNVIFNLIGFGTGWAATPVYIAFKELMAAVVDCKNDVAVLPGLEAMNPRSPFIEVLNTPSSITIDNSLAIISGNAKASVSLKGLLVIVTKLFFLQKNDLIVDTESMYLGTKRSGRVQFFFDEGQEINHFNYFKNGRTRDAILAALKTEAGGLIPGFAEVQNILESEGDRNALLGLDGGQVFQNTVSGTKPIVILLPGIMGSNLTVNNDLVWVKYFKMISGHLKKLDVSNNSNIKAHSLIKTSYKKLVDHLNPKYDVVTFAFDWRLQLNDIAVDFAKKIRELLIHRQPIKIIAHSMGGVLVRDFIVTHPDVWKDLNASNGFRLVFLGSPLGGSYRIPAVLTGKDEIIDKLSMIDIRHTKEELLDMFTKFPGILSLLPHSLENHNDFAKTETWTRMTAPLGKWPLPKKTDLDKFESYRTGIMNALKDMDYSNAVYIAGKDKSTPCGYQINETATGNELVFLCTGEGDQSVTWETGIPKKMIENNSVYYVNVTHGALANEPTIFSAIDELLDKGTTSLISRSKPAVRGDQKLFKQPEQFNFDLSPLGIEYTLLGLNKEKAIVSRETPLQISVSLGDLRYASYPVLAGHFNSDGIINAEKDIDRCLKGVLTQRKMLNLYPGEIGSNTVVLTQSEEFKGTIIVGLGEPGSLTAFNLSKTVEYGITRYLVDLNNEMVSKKPEGARFSRIGISSVAIGSGYGGLTFDNSIRAIISGVQAANQKIAKIYDSGVKTIEFIEFIELYEDKALATIYSLARIESEETKALHIVTNGLKIKPLLGSKKRLPVQSSVNWWERITVQNADKQDGQSVLKFSISTGGAREELRDLPINREMIEQLFNGISNDNRWSPAVAKTIFELLIPNDFKIQVKKQSNISWIVDEDTAGYPWELLQDSITDAKPLCVNAGMIRQMSTKFYRFKINMVTNNKALVIADPNLQGFVNQLPGAYKEGELVSALFLERGLETLVKLNSSPNDIITSVFSDDYKIIHLAGHGVFNADASKPSGMLIGKNVFLSTKEISQMSTVPEFVFVNCCYLGKTNGVAEAFYQDRYRLAANIGTQLIQNGVKVVIAAGWAVDDSAALDFTRRFYECMFNGDNFGESILKARQEIYEKYHDSNNTWGAYQCYGDPFYKFDPTAKSHTASLKFILPEEAEIELNNLFNEMETNKYSTKDYIDRMQIIYAAIELAGIRNGAITEMEALIYAALGEYDFALLKFKELFKNEKAEFSVSTIEKYCNIRAKKYVADFRNGKETAPVQLQKIEQVITDLKGLLMLGDVAERNSLIGSSYKRKAMLCTTQVQKDKAYKDAASFYIKAHRIQSNIYSTYCLTNWFELEAVSILSGPHTWKQDILFGNTNYHISSTHDAINLLVVLKDSLISESYHSDFWHMIAIANVKLCLVILDHSAGEDEWTEVLVAFKSVWQNAGSKGKRMSEIEHLDFLIDAMVTAKKPNVRKLKMRLEQLRNELEKLI